MTIKKNNKHIRFKGHKLNEIGEFVMLVEYFGDEKTYNNKAKYPKVHFKFRKDEAQLLGII